MNVGGTACVASCDTGQTLNGNQCEIPTERAKAGAPNAKALKAAIGPQGTTHRWSADTGGAIPNRREKPTFIGDTNNRIGLLKDDDATVPDLGSWKGSDSSGTHSSGTSAMLRVYF